MIGPSLEGFGSGPRRREWACAFSFPSTDFARPTPAYVLTATAGCDALDVVVA